MNEKAAPRILVASDLTDSAAEAIRQADAYARAVRGVLGVCHVLPDAGVHMLFPERYGREAVEQAALSRRARELVVGGVSTMTGRAPTSLEFFIEQGAAYAEIVRRAESWAANVVFVGHGTSTMLGSVAERVVRHAPCSVFVARPGNKSPLVLAAVDLSKASLRALGVAVAEARRRDAKLVVLHVIDGGIPLGSVGPSLGVTPLVLSPEMLSDLRRMAKSDIESVLAASEANAEIEGHPAPTILRYVEEREPALVVVGTHGRTGLARVALGSVAEHVVRSAGASVLVVRQAS